VVTIRLQIKRVLVNRLDFITVFLRDITQQIEPVLGNSIHVKTLVRLIVELEITIGFELIWKEVHLNFREVHFKQ